MPADNPTALAHLFEEGRTFSHFTPQPVAETLLHQLYDRFKLGPTSANSGPGRFVFVCSEAARARLLPALDAGNVAKVQSAPVTVIVGFDLAFHEHLPTLYPHVDARSWFVGQDAKIHDTALRNSYLQGAYLILAARSLGLDCGPMGGFDPEKVDAAFFAGTSIKSGFLINLGYGDRSRLRPRLPRLDFASACRIE